MASTITTSEVWYGGNTEAYWYEDPKGTIIITANGNQYAETIQTNNVARLQKIVTFTLVFPDYLPEDIDRTYPPALDMQLGPSSSNETKVRIAYEMDKVPDGYIEITESNSVSQLLPNQDDLEYIYLDFDNTKILEEKYRDSVTYEDQQTPIITFYYYTWNWKAVGFSSTVEGYDQSESRKLVESMIK
jgi:hypothetical protein